MAWQRPLREPHYPPCARLPERDMRSPPRARAAGSRPAQTGHCALTHQRRDADAVQVRQPGPAPVVFGAPELCSGVVKTLSNSYRSRAASRPAGRTGRAGPACPAPLGFMVGTCGCRPASLKPRPIAQPPAAGRSANTSEATPLHHRRSALSPVRAGPAHQRVAAERNAHHQRAA